MINKRIHINMNQKVPLIMSFTNKNEAQQVFVETIIMRLHKINHTFNLSRVDAKFLLISLFVFQLTIQYSHGSYLNLPISVVPAAQDLYQQISQKQQQQQQQVANVTPLESIHPTVNSHHSKSTLSPHTEENNSHSSESIRNGSKVDPERHSNNRTGYSTDEITSDKTTPNEQDEILYEGTTAGLTNELISQPATTTSLLDSQIPDFTKSEDFNSMDENSITTKVHYFVPKSKRQALHSQQGTTNLDWWSKISKPNSNSKQHSIKTTQTSVFVDEKGPNQLEHRQEKAPRKRPPTNNSHRHNQQNHVQHSPAGKGVGRGVGTKKVSEGPEINPRSVYKEQPMNQNAILTLKNQLAAIRGKHKQLVSTSVIQLQQLDNKLIESYKLCFKKKMPLYAGMLYRTRDFVVRMAKDVKHESKVLEAMTKQVQNVLRQRMSNKTLIGEYNQLVAKSTESNPSQQQQQQQQHIVTSFESVQIQNDQQSIKVISTNKIGSSSIKVKKESPFEQFDSPHYIQDNTLSQTNEAPQIGKKIRTGTKWPIVASKSPSTDPSVVKLNVPEHDTKNLAATKKPKLKYTVSVNEVNLRKELNKIQALIDRINGSTYEISAVVDDIVRLFKLTSEKKSFSFSSKTSKMDKTHTAHSDDFNRSQQQNDLTATTISTSGHQQMAQKRNKKMLKSPIRVFLERYGKLTMGNLDIPNNNSTVAMSDSENLTNIMMRQPDFKPLFESTNLNYSESLDLDTGFDYITTENE